MKQNEWHIHVGCAFLWQLNNESNLTFFYWEQGRKFLKNLKFLNQGEYEKSSKIYLIVLFTGTFLLCLFMLWMPDWVIGCWDANLYFIPFLMILLTSGVLLRATLSLLRL
jgi:hypothetical protein